MLKFREYVRAESLEDAYVRNQKKSAHILGGMLWLKNAEPDGSDGHRSVGPGTFRY